MTMNELVAKVQTTLEGLRFDQEIDYTEVASQLVSYLDLIYNWNRNTNLVGRAEREELLERHILDSIFVSSKLPASAEIMDIGSGAGLPGVVLAILRPKATVHLIEPRTKPAQFLLEVRRRLSLKNIVLKNGRAEEVNLEGNSNKNCLAVSRAFSPAAKLTSIVDKFIGAGIRFYLVTTTSSPVHVAICRDSRFNAQSVSYCDEAPNKILVEVTANL